MMMMASSAPSPSMTGVSIAVRNEADMMDANASSNNEERYEYLHGNIFIVGAGSFRCHGFLPQPSFFLGISPIQPIVLSSSNRACSSSWHSANDFKFGRQ